MSADSPRHGKRVGGLLAAVVPAMPTSELPVTGSGQLLDRLVVLGSLLVGISFLLLAVVRRGARAG